MKVYAVLAHFENRGAGGGVQPIQAIPVFRPLFFLRAFLIVRGQRIRGQIAGKTLPGAICSLLACVGPLIGRLPVVAPGPGQVVLEGAALEVGPGL